MAGEGYLHSQELLKSIVNDNGGFVCKAAGDANIAIFPIMSNAVIAAAAVRKAFLPLTINSGSEDQRGRELRVVIDAGPVWWRSDDSCVPVVNRGAPLLSSAHSGQILLSSSAAELAKHVLPKMASLRPLGSHRLKDLGPSQPVFQFLLDGYIKEFPKLKTLDRYPNNLPTQPTPLPGRERELTKIFEILKREDLRVLTLTGAAGTGKTRLALRAAGEMIDQFRHGVYFFDLAPLQDPCQVMPAVAWALEVRESMGQDRPLTEILKDYLKSKQMLLLLDNFEHVISAAGEIARFMAACPGIRLLVTSREPLHIRAETLFPVPPLGLPETDSNGHAKSLGLCESVLLFAERVRASNPDFLLVEKDLPLIADICCDLDGLPLAIELAAPNLDAFSLLDLKEGIAYRIKLLTGGARDLPTRQRTLRGALDWSYHLLDEGERELFSWLSVFVGGFTLETVEHVCSTMTAELEGSLLNGLKSLCEKSLLKQIIVAGVTRFWMLETIREYSQLRLAEGSGATAAHRRHALYFLKLAEEAEPELFGPDQTSWLDMLEREGSNLHAAIGWFLDKKKRQEALRMSIALLWFWFRCGHFEKGQQCLEKALGLYGGKKPKKLYGKALHALGSLIFFQGEWSNARDLFALSLEWFRNRGDRRMEGRTLSSLGGGRAMAW